MIEQIKYWQKSLDKLCHNVERRYRLKHIYSSTLFKIEQECFLGFFSVRKMLESDLLEKSVSNYKFKITSRKKLEDTKPEMTHFLHGYDLYNSEDEELTIREIANQFIHSNYFSPFVPFKSKVMGFFVVSDFFVKKKIYYIPLYTVISIFKSVANNNITLAEIKSIEKEGVYLEYNTI